ncbi:S1C family serine protease [Criibacterium bergeronii]|uniref:PDZ domain-containing protein n=1 Tax=Criibacterium bergeronii TaxID=1871336 RepID=A0A371IK28_9FIRM|nr:trypsin-like peptidase domain-containing protein [Criibacterium bergeronii]MBS6062958.1 trypsin-like peptidase domain-containing protein [Peptostreptococcaceae bacterium]RDY20845.1 PDZ domain-containing protein [Criibacterium bergeronii]
MSKKLGTFFAAVMGVLIGCVIAYFALISSGSGEMQKAAVGSGATTVSDKQIEDKIDKIISDKSKNIQQSEVENIYKNVAKKAMPSVVGVTTVFYSQSSGSIYDMMFGGMPSSPRLMEGVGTGVIVDKAGYILTNSHVVQDGDVQKVNVLFNDGTSQEAEVKWSDKSLDLALIKVDTKGKNLQVATLGDSSKVEVGDIAVAIGNPMGLEFQRTVTQGIISGLERSVNVENVSMSNLIQTDASINQGNSGGPLLNSKAEVIGINTVKGSGEGLGFSIPINTAKMFVDLMKQNGEIKDKPLLGIQGISVDQLKAAKELDLKETSGVFVAQVAKNSPASSAGMKQGDIIIGLDGQEIKNMSDLQAQLYKVGQGDMSKVEIKYNHRGETKTVTINLTNSVPEKEQPQQPQQQMQNPWDSLFGRQ